MQAILLETYSSDLSGVKVGTKPVPRPGPGEVLVQILASPINPSDLMFLQGHYGVKKTLPVVPGFEGSGRVVAAGSGTFPKFLLGKKVTCSAPQSGDGTWAEFMKVPAASCFPIGDQMSVEQASMLLVNPFTAWAFLERARKEKVKAIVQTAAGSQLGQMVWRLAEKSGIPQINIVRRVAQKHELLKSGMKNVLCTAEESFESQLKQLSSKLGVTIAFDAVGGDTAETLTRALPPGTTLIIYGGLSGQDPKASLSSLIFEGKKIEGFWLTHWIQRKNLVALGLIWRKIRKHIGTEFKSEIRESVPLSEARRVLQLYSDQMSGGKILFRPTSEKFSRDSQNAI